MSNPLADLSIRELADVAAADVKGEAPPSVREWFTENPERWRLALVEIIGNLNQDFSVAKENDIKDKTAWARREVDYETFSRSMGDRATWRRKASYFRRKVESTLADCKTQIRESNIAAEADRIYQNRGAERSRIHELEQAIRRHRAANEEADIEPEVWDKELWMVLED